MSDALVTPYAEANESFNTTVWRLSPKHLHLGLKVVENSAYIAAGIFNEGFSLVLRIINLLNSTLMLKYLLINQTRREYPDSIVRSFLKQKMLVQLASNNYWKKSAI